MSSLLGRLIGPGRSFGWLLVVRHQVSVSIRNYALNRSNDSDDKVIDD
jgi:hypothetical protein